MGSVDYTSIREKIKNVKKLEVLADKKVQAGVEEAKSNFIEQFEEHPITKEIQDGPEASNSSGTLNGQGNLFSFIGFETFKFAFIFNSSTFCFLCFSLFFIFCVFAAGRRFFSPVCCCLVKILCL